MYVLPLKAIGSFLAEMYAVGNKQIHAGVQSQVPQMWTLPTWSTYSTSFPVFYVKVV